MYQNKSQRKVAKQFVRQGKYNGLISFNLNLQLIYIYIYMLYKILTNTITIGQFNMYLSSAQTFSQNINSFLNSWVEFRTSCKYLSLYIKFKETEIEKTVLNNEISLTSNERIIEFRNVWFKYSGSNDYSLKNINIKISSKENLTIVGENGAGKSTFIKLLCKLYKPEKGSILLNGIDINKYNDETYYNELSLVFQDFKLYAFSIKENIFFSKSDNICDKKLEQLLTQVDLYNKVSSLKHAADTPLFKAYNEEGIELSGGESQKLAIARALNNNASILILDEPTASLDPIAEYELYNKLNSLALDKTTIFVSHRLTACKFCDKIAVFKKGEMIEYGSHNELIQQGGYYNKMWTTQSTHYFK